MYATAALLRHRAKSSRLSTGKTQRSKAAAEECCKAASWIGGIRLPEHGVPDEAEDCRGEDGRCTEMCGPVSVVRTARLGRDFEDEKCANRFRR